MNNVRHVLTASKVTGARAEIKARREGRDILIRGALNDRRAELPISVDELAAVIAQALREVLK